MSQPVVIDLTNYRDRSGTRVAEGSYLVQVEDLEVGQTKAKDATMLTVFLRIIGGEHDGDTLIDRLTLKEAAMFRVVGFLNGLGIKTPRKRIQVDPQRIIGRKVRVDVADGTPYNGVIRSEIKAYIRLAKVAEPTADDFDGIEDEETETAEVEAPKAEKAKKEKKGKKSKATEVDPDDIDLDDVEL